LDAERKQTSPDLYLNNIFRNGDDKDGEKVVEGRISKTVPGGFSADEGINVGADDETPSLSFRIYFI
jgi:hypothetical protein